MNKNYDIQTAEMLGERFPYMFNKPNIGFSFYRGWMPILAGVCVDIDKLLVEHREVFHWTQIKEKFGSARFYYAFGGAEDLRVDLQLECGLRSFSTPLSPENKTTDLKKEISGLVSAAEQETARCCFVCGQPGKAEDFDGYLQTLCADHHPDKFGPSEDESWKVIWKLATPAASSGKE